MTVQFQSIRLTTHHRELFLRPCPNEGCDSATLCRADYRGQIVGSCRGCDWIGVYEEVESTRDAETEPEGTHPRWYPAFDVAVEGRSA